MFSDLYNENEKCMNFSNEEIVSCLINKLNNYKNVNIILKDENDKIIFSNSKDKIATVIFDGIKEEFFINFYDKQTSLFFNNEEIMFIDDNIKYLYTISDTHLNIVYEGNLRNKTHEEILTLFLNIIKILLGYDDINVEYIPIISKDRTAYPYFDNIITVYSKDKVNKDVTFENLTFKLV